MNECYYPVRPYFFSSTPATLPVDAPATAPPTLAALLAVLFMFRLYAPMPPACTTQFATVGTQQYPTSPMSLNTR